MSKLFFCVFLIIYSNLCFSAVVIDDFTLPLGEGRQAVEYNAIPDFNGVPVGPVITSTISRQNTANIIGGSRVMQLQVLSGTSTGFVEASAGKSCELCRDDHFFFNIPSSIAARARLVWDATTNFYPDFESINPTGLGGVNLARDGDDAIVFGVGVVDLNVQLKLRLYTSAQLYSEVFFNAVDVLRINRDGKSELLIPFSLINRSPGNGALAPANINSIGAISLEIPPPSFGATSLDIAIDSLTTGSLCDPPCENGGRCTGVNTCDCRGTRFEGPTCEDVATTCECYHGGICEDETETQNCNCEGTGYTGFLCGVPECDPTCEELAEALAQQPAVIVPGAIAPVDPASLNSLDECTVRPNFRDDGLTCVRPNICACGTTLTNNSPFIGFWLGYEEGCLDTTPFWRLYVPPESAAESFLHRVENGVTTEFIHGQFLYCEDDDSNLPFIKFDLLYADVDESTENNTVWNVRRGILEFSQEGKIKKLRIALAKFPGIARPIKFENSDRTWVFEVTQRPNKTSFLVNDDGVLIGVPGGKKKKGKNSKNLKKLV